MGARVLGPRSFQPRDRPPSSRRHAALVAGLRPDEAPAPPPGFVPEWEARRERCAAGAPP